MAGGCSEGKRESGGVGFFHTFGVEGYFVGLPGVSSQSLLHAPATDDQPFGLEEGRGKKAIGHRP